MIPSERFLIFHRVITFLDEWLFYVLLTYLYFNGAPFYIMAPVISIGATAILFSYKRLWKWENFKYNV